MTRLFVYGTLRKGCNSHYLLKNPELIDHDLQIAGFKMFNLGSYPVLVETGKPEDRVIGELYRLEENLLTAIDNYEGREYQRKFLKEHDFWIFLANPKLDLSKYPVVESGNWKIK
jgi:gamma-glutamylcyclotransferase (GGCT)/AIG2-like uncharacterized protein YtfP